MKTSVKMEKLFLIFICLSLFFQCVSARHIPRIPNTPRNIKCKIKCEEDFYLCLNDREIQFLDIFTCLNSKHKCMPNCQKNVYKRKERLALDADSLYDIIGYENKS